MTPPVGLPAKPHRPPAPNSRSIALGNLLRADDPLAPQRLEGVVGKADLGKNFPAMFAQLRRSAANEHRCLEAGGGTGLAQSPGARMLTFKQDAGGQYLRVGNHLGAGENRSTGDACRLEPLQPFL